MTHSIPCRQVVRCGAGRHTGAGAAPHRRMAWHFVISHDERAPARIAGKLLRTDHGALDTAVFLRLAARKARQHSWQRCPPSQAVSALQMPELPTQHLGLGDPVQAGLRLGTCAKAAMVAAAAVRVGAALARRALACAGTAPMVGQVMAWHLVVPHDERAPARIAQKFPSRNAPRVTQWVVLQGLRPDNPCFDLFRPVLTGSREASISPVRATGSRPIQFLSGRYITQK